MSLKSNRIHQGNCIEKLRQLGPGSVDLGIKSLVGSRAANSLILGSALDIMGAGGYAVLIDCHSMPSTIGGPSRDGSRGSSGARPDRRRCMAGLSSP